MTNFKEWDLIRMTQDCSGCIKWEIYPLHYGNKCWNAKELLNARDSSLDGFWCSCQYKREIVEDKEIKDNKPMRNTYKKIYIRQDGYMFVKEWIYKEWELIRTIEDINKMIDNRKEEIGLWEWLLKSHRNLKF